MANYEATKYDFDGSNLTDIQGVNTGLIIPWCAASVPSGFLDCDGAAVSRTTYADLFAVIGTTYGSGDGSTTFNVPDLQDKVVKGKSPTTNLGTAVNTNTVSTTGNITANIANTSIGVPTMASHNHSGGTNSYVQGGNPGVSGIRNDFAPDRQDTGSAGGAGGHSHNASANFTGDAADVVQPINVTKYIIKT